MTIRSGAYNKNMCSIALCLPLVTKQWHDVNVTNKNWQSHLKWWWKDRKTYDYVTSAHRVWIFISPLDRQMCLAHLLFPLCALCSAKCLTFSLPALVPSRALGTRPGTQHRSLHTCCYLGLHLLKTPTENERRRGGRGKDRHIIYHCIYIVDKSINETHCWIS